VELHALHAGHRFDGVEQAPQAELLRSTHHSARWEPARQHPSARIALFGSARAPDVVAIDRVKLRHGRRGRGEPDLGALSRSDARRLDRARLLVDRWTSIFFPSDVDLMKS
jgi:hypothetical protein